MPALHTAPSQGKLIRSVIGIWFTVIAWALYVITTVVSLLAARALVTGWQVVETISYLLIVTFLCFSALMYQVARRGAFLRFQTHARAPRADLDRHFSLPHEPLTVLVPSYAEEPAVVRKTLWSAALQEYPALRVVLLIDDAPHPSDPAVAERLELTRELPSQIEQALAGPAQRFADALWSCEHEMLVSRALSVGAMERLVEEYQEAARWLREMALTESLEDHVDAFFVDEILIGLAEDLDATAQAVETALAEGERLPAERVRELFRRLVWIFRAEVTSFERKKYASLSHEANKAMNLNAYIGLIGGRFAEHETPDGLLLRPVVGNQPDDVNIPNSDFVLTLDADSLLLRDYCLRLVYLLEQPENAHVAVAQTPYSSFRGAGTRIERLSGATTDLQHILHQGMTAYDATFWVGANAVIRMEALDDILEVEIIDGFEVRRYVQDRTVIEDTESSVDLGAHGWKLINYPERLSYSATPPDFGSLVVQRRRWANGGLLILPKLWHQVRERRHAHRPIRTTELMLRVNYMSSIAWASFGLIFMLVYPYDSRLLSPLVLLAALPYFFAMASDLHYAGYKRSDVLRIYGLNLILLPVNLAGVLKSLQQGVTGMKIPFARTPKVKDRTATPLLYVIAPLAIILYSGFAAWRGLVDGNWGNCAFAVFNTVCATWSFVSNIGLRNAAVDVWIGATDWMWVDRDARARRVVAAAEAESTEPDWREVIYRGHGAPGAVTAAAQRAGAMPVLHPELIDVPREIVPESDVHAA